MSLSHPFFWLEYLIPEKEERTGLVYGGVGSDDDSDNHGKGKIVYDFTSEDKERKNRQKGRS